MWVKIDDQLPDHPKMLSVAPTARWLFISCLCYCNRYQTDGRVPEGIIGRYGSTDDRQQLLDANLFEMDDAGLLVHDYLDYQPSRETMHERRIEAHQQKVRAGTSRAASAGRVAGRFVSNETAGQNQHNQRSSSGTPPALHQPRTRTRSTKTLVTPLVNENFEDFWKSYPRKDDKARALKAYDKAIEKGVSPEDVLSSCQRYAASRQGEPSKYTKLAATWLNGECWLNEGSSLESIPTGSDYLYGPG